MQDAVAKIYSSKERRSQHLGTAFAVSDGIGLTAFHCIGNRKTGEVTYPLVVLEFPEGDPIAASVADYDHVSDFAVLKFEVPPPASLRRFRLAIDAPAHAPFRCAGYAIVDGVDVTLTNGVIVSTTSSILGGVPAIQLDCEQAKAGMSLNGMSGGPVLVGNPEAVVGLVRWNPERYNWDESLIAVGGMVFACPIRSIVERCTELMQFEIAAPTSSIGASLDDLADFTAGIAKSIPRLKGRRLRVLLLSSLASHPNSLEGELGNIRATLGQLLMQPGLESPVAVEAWQIEDEGFTIWTTKSKTRTSGEPDLGEFDLVIMVAWHNLGIKNSLEEWDKKWRALPSNQQPARLIYRRMDYVESRPDDSDQSVELRKNQVIAFVKTLDENGTRFTSYQKKNFVSIFLSELPSALDQIISRSEGLSVSSDDNEDSQILNPFLGLRSYGQNDGHNFFGRWKEVEELCHRLSTSESQLIAVVGASGSGKSSLVRAGLLYRLSIDTVAGSRDWKVVDFKLSGYSDYVAMPKACLGIQVQGESRENKLGGSSRRVILVDQFEEIFSLVKDERQQIEYAKYVSELAQSPRTTVIITLRADFYERALLLDPLGELLATSVYSPSAPSPGAIFSIITLPAAFSGLEFEDDILPVEIFQDAGGNASVLPLLSCALEEIAKPQRRRGKTILRKAFDDLGGINGIIEKKAEEGINDIKQQQIDGELPPFDIETELKRIFLQLVKVGDGVETTRKPMDYSDANLRACGWTEGARRLVEKMVEMRLFTADDPHIHDPSSEKKLVLEIAHEAVLTKWGSLSEWIVDCRAALLSKQRLEILAKEWDVARSAEPDPKMKLKIDGRLLWRQDRIDAEKINLGLLGIQLETWDNPVVQRFLRPEKEWLIEELCLAVDHSRRFAIGERLEALGDTRRGVGIRNGKPDIQWCKVPGGSVYIEGKPTPLPMTEFYISKYIVTLAQFNAFAKSDDYVDERWWKDLPVNPFKHRPYEQSGGSNHPAKYVSWYQAMAYCAWLGDLLDYAIRLPTEEEWQQAATGGLDSYVYPWGSDWNSNNANTKEGGGDRLMSVGMYPITGASPVGALDMAGNIVEWCMNECSPDQEVEPSERLRVTKGGAYFSFKNVEARESVKVSARLYDKENGVNNQGNRILVAIRLACDRPVFDQD